MLDDREDNRLKASRRFFGCFGVEKIGKQKFNDRPPKKKKKEPSRA